MNRRSISSHLTRAEVEALAPSVLRDLTLDGFEREDEAHRYFSVGETPYALFHYTGPSPKGTRHGLIILQGTQPVEHRLRHVRTLLQSDRNLRSTVLEAPLPYLGVSAQFDAMMSFGMDDWRQSGRRQETLAAADYRRMRVIVGVCADGGEYIIRRDPENSVLAEVESDPMVAALRFDLPAMPELRRIQVLALTEHQRRTDTPNPDSALDDLVPWSGPKEPWMSTLALRHTMVHSTWRPGQPRTGRVFPPLPQEHAFAALPCSCERPLANGLPVREIVLGPVGGDPLADLTGDRDTPLEVVATIVHRDCAPKAAYHLARGVAAGAARLIQDDE